MSEHGIFKSLLSDNPY
jgi:hypothetical protein